LDVVALTVDLLEYNLCQGQVGTVVEILASGKRLRLSLAILVPRGFANDRGGLMDSDFSSRMFVYNYRIRDCYDAKIVSLTILGDDRSNWRPEPFRDELWDCEVTFRFPMVKLLDYEPRWLELEASRNLFAIAVMAHLKTKETKKDPQSRKEWKFQLTRRLYEQGFERQDIMELFLFVDWMMELPEGLKREFKTELDQYEQEKQMRYVSSIEEIAIDEARNLKTATALGYFGNFGGSGWYRFTTSSSDLSGIWSSKSMLIRFHHYKCTD
jgi:hypothetical protein